MTHTLETAIKLVTPFASTDVTRPHLCRPFGAVVDGKQYLAATDGHRAALVRCADAADVKGEGTPPRIDYVIPRAAKRVGQFNVEELAPLRHLPRSWNACLEIGREGCRLNAIKSTGSGKREKHVKIFSGVAPGWPILLEELSGGPVGINTAYLLDAVDMIGTLVVHVSRTSDPLAPFVFTATSDPFLDARAFALVMPVLV